ncbi:MAG: STAS domain-containing protein [Verrucomicrobiota bacterium]
MNIMPVLNDGILKLTLNGRFDTFGAGPVQQVLDSYFNKHPRFVIMDMSGVDFISSAGIRVLLITAKEAEGRKGILALVGLNPYCRELITHTHITGILAQFDTMDQAEAFLDQAKAFCREKTPSGA